MISRGEKVGDWTASTCIRAVRDVGFPVAAAAFLLWVVTLRVPADLDACRRAVEENRQHLVAIRALLERRSPR